MRTLFSFNMMTLDGYFEGPERDITWHNVDAEFNDYAIKQLHEIDTLLFGRVTYQMMASYWSTPAAIKDDPTVANLMNQLPKLVFSRTLQKAEWSNTRLIKENVAEEISKMKNGPGKSMAVFGSADLLSTLIQKDLVDEHRLMINPVLLGRGTPLFKGLQGKLNLELIRSRSFHNGNMLLVYRPVKPK